jgi:hypothetical protein
MLKKKKQPCKIWHFLFLLGKSTLANNYLGMTFKQFLGSFLSRSAKTLRKLCEMLRNFTFLKKRCVLKHKQLEQLQKIFTNDKIKTKSFKKIVVPLHRNQKPCFWDAKVRHLLHIFLIIIINIIFIF